MTGTDYRWLGRLFNRARRRSANGETPERCHAAASGNGILEELQGAEASSSASSAEGGIIPGDVASIEAAGGHFPAKLERSDDAYASTASNGGWEAGGAEEERGLLVPATADVPEDVPPMAPAAALGAAGQDQQQPPPGQQLQQMQHSLCLMGDALELIVAPGDVLLVKGSGRLAAIGAAGGLFGHVLLVLGSPEVVSKGSAEAASFEDLWPDDSNVEELWKVPILESTRNETGLHQIDLVLYVDRSSGHLVIVGQVLGAAAQAAARSERGAKNACAAADDSDDEDLAPTPMEHEQVELWQSPFELRSFLRTDIMMKVLAEMMAKEASWSHMTAAKAVLSSARLAFRRGTDSAEQTLKEVRSRWLEEPICTSVVIVFWQRYLCELAEVCASDPLDLILRWMPLKADRGLPGDLVGAMRSCGWVTLTQVPRIFRHTVTVQAVVSYSQPLCVEAAAAPAPLGVDGSVHQALLPQLLSAPQAPQVPIIPRLEPGGPSLPVVVTVHEGMSATQEKAVEGGAERSGPVGCFRLPLGSACMPPESTSYGVESRWPEAEAYPRAGARSRGEDF